MLCVHVVVETLNLEISRCHLADDFKELYYCVPHVQHDYFSSFNQSDHCFLASSLALPPSLLKLPDEDDDDDDLMMLTNIPLCIKFYY